jgi:hypothetical protein
VQFGDELADESDRVVAGLGVELGPVGYQNWVKVAELGERDARRRGR